MLVVGTVAHIGATLLLWIGLKPYIRSLNYLKDWTKAHAAESMGTAEAHALIIELKEPQKK